MPLEEVGGASLSTHEEAILTRIVALLDRRDRLVDQPSRLAILTRLRRYPEGEAEGGECSYRELLRGTGLSEANLSAHLGKLEEAGYVEVTGRFVDVGRLRPVPRRFARLTSDGRRAVEAHWEAMLEVSRLSEPRGAAGGNTR